MYRSRFRKPSRPMVFAGLMAVSLIAALLPGDPLGALRNLAQILALPQMYLHDARLLSARVADDLAAPPVDPKAHEELRNAHHALEHATIQQAREIEELREEVRQLSQIRKAGFPPKGALIPARVLAGDAAVGRSSLLIGRGTTDKAMKGDWVVSGFFVDVGADDGVPEQAAVLAREYLVGWIGQTMPMTSRIMLVSDELADHLVAVNIVPRRGDDHLPVRDHGRMLAFNLQGIGNRRMRIPDIPRSLIESGKIQVDDLVVSDPRTPGLPVAMMIGQIEALELVRDDEKPLYYDATVRLPYDPELLSRVYIVDLSKVRVPGR